MSTLSKEILRQIITDGDLKTTGDLQSYLKDMFKGALQEMLEAELDIELGYQKGDRKNKKTPNRRNGHSQKKMKTQFGEMELNVPRDRNGEFEPKVVPKNKRNISGIEQKIISLYARGMSTRDIHDQINEIYGIEVSAEMVSKITEKIIPEINQWQSRPLDPMYPFVFMDAIHFKVRQDNQIVKKAAYVVLAVNKDGLKNVLGIWIGENETSKFWLSVLNSLKNRGLEDVMVFCVDGLSGFNQAIEATYPNAEVQRCIIHQIRNTLKYVPYKDRKKLAKDLKTIYTAPDEESGFEALMGVRETWDKKYPYAIKSWEDNWDSLSTFFKYSNDVRKIIYTTNIIESLNRQYRKVTKTKSIFPSDESLEKILYLATKNITKKWSRRYDNWDIIVNQLCIMYEEKFEQYL
ncbi:IS256 family transposase [Dethiothermospora halolimnae]|uniref:IS256 family transposase n=1 Tax=Dethiothermospora halolimnae TaxID=3114390 RepID=UPI003CCB814F